MIPDQDFILIYIICASREEAKEIASALLENKLVACANIFPAHQSIFRWEEKTQVAEETAVIFKTTQDKFQAVEAKILKMHSYECPCIVALPIEQGHEPFLQWIASETSST